MIVFFLKKIIKIQEISDAFLFLFFEIQVQQNINLQTVQCMITITHHYNFCVAHNVQRFIQNEFKKMGHIQKISQKILYI